MALDSHILTILEPSIKLDEMKAPNAGEGTTGDNFSGLGGGGEVPHVRINDYMFTLTDIQAFNLNLNGRYPELTMKITDEQDSFTVDRFPRDGDLLNLRIELDEAGTYKDIRMDFNILEFRGIPTSPNEKSKGKSMYSVRAIAKIPGMYTDECKSYGENTSLEHVKAIATDLKLGVATNIGGTDDAMRRFCAYQTKLETLANTVLHSYITDDAFQTYSIDPYYYINFVNLQMIFNAPDDVDIHEAIANSNLGDQGGEPKTGKGSKEVQLILTNNHLTAGFNTHIAKHALVNNSTKIALENGYKRKMQYFDVDDNEFDLVEFDVESLTSDNIKDIEEPLKGRRNSEVDEYNTHIKQKYVGIQNDNTHLNYNFAAINNIQNMVELDKLYLEVELAQLNPAIYRYMKVPVAIYNYGQINNAVAVDHNKKAREGDFKPQTDEITKDGGDNENDNNADTTFTLDEFLTAHYIVMGIQYKYSPLTGYTQVLKLARREWPARLNNM